MLDYNYSGLLWGGMLDYWVVYEDTAAFSYCTSEATDTLQQHSQFNKMVLPLFPTQLAEFKVHNIIVIKYFLRML